jgi:hypothetical protein
MFGAKTNETTPFLTAQQTNLVRSVIDSTYHLEMVPSRDPSTGRKSVRPLEAHEFSRFRSAWTEAPVGCIRSMNRAIALLEDPTRFSRYLDAALDLELLMDREWQGLLRGRDLIGVPSYLADGYTDFGIHTASAPTRRRERIVVDKEKLRSGLVSSKRHAVEAMAWRWASSHPFEAELRDLAVSLRKELGYDEAEAKTTSADDTVPLSQSMERHDLNCRHLSILYQLRLQEAGISSRLVKGILRLFHPKLRHVWNVAEEGGTFALVDATFADKEGPFVLSGSTMTEVYQRAAEQNRLYYPSPESGQRYQVRTTIHGSTPGNAFRPDSSNP